MNEISERISRIGIMPVVRLNRPERDAVNLAKALCAGGIPAAEITFRAGGAAKAIKLISENVPEVLVGAGTVLSEEIVDEALEAGARFIVSPGLDEDVVKYCQSKNVPIYAGCSTPTDYCRAYRLGLDVLKFFPAEQSGGVKKIKALGGPFPNFRIMPTGGVSLKNLGEYSACPLVAACGGSYMARPELVDAQKWDEIINICKKSVEIVREARKNG